MAYNGLLYGGWQKQTFGVNVQEVVENCLSKILKTPINTIGCGRTDSLVHASQFFFHFDFEGELDSELVLFKLNKSLPADIVIFDIILMEGQPHARFDAFHRKYDYFIHTEKNPFLNGLSALYEEKNLDFAAMKQAVSLLPNYDDYRAFCKSPNQYEHTICRVSSAHLFIDPTETKIRFQISSNRFLGRMIRIIMTKLLDIGRGKLTVDEFESHLISKETPAQIIPAHPQGLYLSKVSYRFLDLPVKQSLSASPVNEALFAWKEL